MSFLGFIPWNMLHDQRMKDTERDRISNEEFQWNEEMANMHNTNEVTRQSDFLAGMAQPSADAYNTYQDTAFQGDTTRQIGRIQQTGEALGMNPWELNGGGAATPQVSGEFLKGQAKNTQDQQASSIAIAQMNNQTQRDIAAMQADTSIRNTAMQTGNTEEIANANRDWDKEKTNITTDFGKIPQAERLRIEKDTDRIFEARELLRDQQDATHNASMMNFARTMYDFMPKLQIDSPAGTLTETASAGRIRSWLTQNFDKEGHRNQNFTPLADNDYSDFAKTIQEYADKWARDYYRLDEQRTNTGTLGTLGGFLNGQGRRPK